MIEKIKDEHLLYALLLSLVNDIGGIVKLSTEEVVKIVSEMKHRIDLYEEDGDIFIEVVEENESKSKEIV